MSDDILNKYKDKIKEMKMFNSMHSIDASNCYMSDEERDIRYFKKSLLEPQSIAKYIHKNYDRMDDCEKRLLLQKVLTSNRVNNELLKFELKYYQPTPVNMSLETFGKKAYRLLKRYQGKAGGFYIEDNEWALYDHTSEKYRLRKNKVIFENTIDILDSKDNETIKFIKRLVNKLNYLADNIEVSYDIIESNEDSLSRIYIECKDKSIKIEKSAEISL